MTIEKTLFAAADKMRGAMDPGEYKHVALGLLFLSYISTAFGRKYEHLVEADGVEAAEDRDEYLADGIFWVPSRSLRWRHLSANSKDPKIGIMVDRTPMRAIEADNEHEGRPCRKVYAVPGSTRRWSPAHRTSSRTSKY